MKRRSIGLLIASIIILSGFGYLIYGGIGDNLVYFLTPGELLAKGPDARDRPVRLGGLVEPASVKWDAAALDLSFTLQDEGGSIAVHSTKAPPAMFREGQGVIVEGRLGADGVFEATTVMVKHSNEYRPPEDGHADPAVMYRSLIRE